MKKFPFQIGALCILAAIAPTHLVSAAESIRVDGVQVYGKIHDVSLPSIREAIKASTDLAKGGKPRALEIINGREMREYLPNAELGYRELRLLMTHELDGREHLTWNIWDCCGIQDPPVALRLIRAADHVYIFPIKNSWKPHRDDKHMRMLDQKARKELVHLLGHQSDWWAGGYSLVDVEPTPEIGFVFQHGRDELVLFFSGTTVEGTLNGKFTSGMLEAKRDDQFHEWKRRYAQRELPTK